MKFILLLFAASLAVGAELDSSSLVNLERAGFDLFPPKQTRSNVNIPSIVTVTTTVRETVTKTRGGGFFGFNKDETITETITNTTTQTTTELTTETQTLVEITTLPPNTITVTASLPIPPPPPPPPPLTLPSIPIKDAINIIIAVVEKLHDKNPLLDTISHLTNQSPKIDLGVLWKIVQEILKNSLNPKPFPMFAIDTDPIDGKAIASWTLDQLS